MRIILIGNAELKQDEKFGSLIDEFEVVVRINRFRVETFEEHLGSKTDIWAMNRTLPFNRAAVSFNFQKEYGIRKKTSESLDHALMVSYMPNDNEYIKVLNSVQQVENLRLAETLIESSLVRDRWEELVPTGKPFYKPATGIMSILYFIRKYGEICIHNFDNAKTNHYYENTQHMPWMATSQPKASRHVWSFDEKMINELVNEDKVKYLRDL